MRGTSFLEAWAAFDSGKAPYVLKGDEDLLRRPDAFVVHPGWAEYARSGDIDLGEDRRYHLGLLPQPFHGKVRTASVYVLLLNPGLNPGDYFAEARQPEFRAALAKQLRTADEPFLFLQERFAWHPGFAWWFGKLARTIEAYSVAAQVKPAEGRLRFADRLAAIELVPYHSASFGAAGVDPMRVESVRLAREFVHDHVLTRAEKGECIVVVTRKVREWGIPAARNVVLYDRWQAMGASLGPGTPGGKAILRAMLEYGRSPKPMPGKVAARSRATGGSRLPLPRRGQMKQERAPGGEPSARLH